MDSAPLALCSLEYPETIGYMNVYETGDIWIKTNGCKGCVNEKKCCGDCRMLTQEGCMLHNNVMKKPYVCVVLPPPNVNNKWCQLEFLCIKGKNKGKTKRVCDAKIME